MKHLKYADKSFLVGDDIGGALVEYAALLVDSGHAESITIRGVSPDGNEVDATLLLAAGTSLVAESTNSGMVAPDNSVVAHYLTERIEQLRNPPQVQPETIGADLDIDAGLPFD